MKSLFSLSIRSQMLLLIFVMSLAPVGMIIYTATDQKKDDEQIIQSTAIRLSDDVGAHQCAMVAGVEQLLSSFPYIPCIQQRNVRETSALLTEFVHNNSLISDIIIADTRGHVWASTQPATGRASIADRSYFKNALASGRFSSGEVTTGGGTDSMTFCFGYPLRDRDGKIRDVAVASFSLSSYGSLLKAEEMPPNSTLALADRKGTILFYSEHPEFTGKDDKSDIYRRISAGPDRGNFEAVGLTGKPRYFSYRKLRLAGEQAPYLYVRVGILKASLFSDNLIFNVIIMFFFTLLATLFAFYLFKREIIDKIVALRNATQQIGNGNLLVEVSGAVSGGELGELACTFDEMARSLAADFGKREQMLNSIRESEAKYRMLVETANEGIWVTDGESCTTFVNSQMAEILGYHPFELVGRKTDIFIAPEETDEYQKQLDLRRHGKSSRYEMSFMRKDGSPVYLSVSASPLLDGHGTICGSFAMMNDITDRKQAEHQLSESRLLLEKTLASLNEAIFIVDSDSRTILDCNISCERMLGYSRSEMIGASTDVLHVSAEMSERFCREMQQAYGNKGYYETAFVTRRKDGSVFDSEHSVTPIRNEAGEIIKHVSVIRDISERVQLQQRLEVRKKLVESILEHLKSGIIVVDYDYRIIMLNESAIELSGEPAELFTGKDLAEICPQLKEQLIAGISQGEITVSLFNESRVIGFTKIDLPSTYIGSKGYIINFKDLTEEIKIRKQLHHKERLSAMGEVVASVAHEMRNPLFAMTTVAQILEMELPLSPGQQELVNSLLREAKRLNNLVGELLDSTRELRLQKKVINLNAVVTEAFRILRTGTDNKKVILRKRAFAEQIHILADFEKIQQVLLNVIKNAMEASPPGSFVDLEITAGDDEVIVSVRDCGSGIPQEAMEKIFEVFYTTKKHGTGLGLSICKNIIEAHGGSLNIGNNPDAGATVTITLPRRGDTC